MTTDAQGRVLMRAWAQDHGLVGSTELPGTAGSLTLPRELTLVGDQLLQRLPSELVGLRSRALVAARALAAGDNWVGPGPEQLAVEVLLRASGTDVQERTVTVRTDGASIIVPAPTVGGEIEIKLPRELTLVELPVDGASLTARWYGRAGQADVVVSLDGDDVSATLDGVWALVTDVVVPAELHQGDRSAVKPSTWSRHPRGTSRVIRCPPSSVT